MYNNIIQEACYHVMRNNILDKNLVIEAFREIITSRNEQFRDIQLSGLFYSLVENKLNEEIVHDLILEVFKCDNFRTRSIKLEGVKNITCVAGSGKKQIKTVNISTLSAIVAASLGAMIIKPASTAFSSQMGSSELLQTLGISLCHDPFSIEKMLQQCGIAFISIENSIPKFDAIYGGRFLTINPLSFALPALLTPIYYDNVLFGISNKNQALSFKTLKKFGIENILIASSCNDHQYFIDEMGLFENNYYTSSKNIGDSNFIVRAYHPIKDIGLNQIYNLNDLSPKSNHIENLELLINAISGRGNEIYIDMLSMNASAILQVSGMVEDLREGFTLSKASIKKKEWRLKN